MADMDEDAPKKKGGMLKWIIILVLLLLLGGGGYFAYTQFLAGDDNATEAEAPASENPNAVAEGELTGESEIVPLPTFLVNLADPLGRRYLKMTLDVELVNKEAADKLNQNTPKIRDAIILLLSSKSYSDLSTFESKLLLKKEIVERLNLILGGARVRNVYFTDMVIQ